MSCLLHSILGTVAVIGFTPVLYTVEEGRRSLSVNVTHQIGALGRTVTLSVFTVDGSATGTVCVCVGGGGRVEVCAWRETGTGGKFRPASCVWVGVWEEGRGVDVHGICVLCMLLCVVSFIL